MNKTFKSTLLATICTVVMAAPVAVQATNGYFSHGYGTKNKGLAGGGVALAQDAMAAATNPAGMVFVGNRMDLGASLFSPSDRSYNASSSISGGACGGPGLCPFTIGGATGSQSITSENDVFLIPHFGRNWMLDANTSIGFSVYGNGGMNTEYEGGSASHESAPGSGVSATTPGTFGAGTAGVNLEQLFIATTYARKYANHAKTSWGISGIFAVQRFKATGLANFGVLSVDAANLSSGTVDQSTGVGIKLGVLSEVQPGLTLGASVQSRIYMNEFDKYAGLFAESGDFDIPATATIGLAWHHSANAVFTADVQFINYADVKAIANPISYLVGATNSCATMMAKRCLGGADGAGFGWDDMTIFKLGYQWQQDNEWTWRVGFSTTDQPIPASETMFNILAPAVRKSVV